MPIKKVLADGPVPVKVWADDLEPAALQQLKNIARVGIVHRHVAVMPDAHLGIGCTIGTVVPTMKAIIPAAVGVDIGCGMMAAQTNLAASSLPDSLRRVREDIESAIPLGPGRAHRTLPAFAECAELDARFLQFAETHPTIRKLHSQQKWVGQMGTLGGGNHFIEICLDEDDHVWVMLHSGSRGVGNRLAQYFINLAKEDMRTHHLNLPDRNLAYLEEGTRHFKHYLEAVHWAQDYARLNRHYMMQNIFAVLTRHFPGFGCRREVINCHHNYVEREHHFGKDVYVTRKGAIKAGQGDWGIIPGSMGAKSFIVRGKGNPESFNSCAHGAGRKMSRKEAFRRFNLDDLERQTQGVELARRRAIIDEIPGAYKDIDKVMAEQDDLVEVVHTLKQVVCVKGD
ncbi:MAG: RtcB family protein [Nitrospinaceae bacterium]